MSYQLYKAFHETYGVYIIGIMNFWLESLAVKHVVSLGKAAPPLCAPARQSLWSATIQSLPDVSLEA